MEVVGFLAAVVQLIDVTSKVVNYFNGVKNAPKDRAKLAREATGLLLLFTDLRCRVEEVNTSTDPWFTSLRSLGEAGGPLMEFKNAMEDIADKLAPTTSMSLGRVLRWTLDKKEIEAILSKIERLQTLVGLALQKDHFKLSLAMKEELTRISQETKISRDDLSLATKEITMGFQKMKTNHDELSLAVKEDIMVQLALKINQWLAAPTPFSNHNNAVKKREPRTGEWFTQSKEFADWKVGTSSFIWLHGIPGCGKTILCSTIIQDVLFHFQSEPAIAVAYFYFDFNDLDKQRTEKLIRSLIVQLSAQCLHLPEWLQSAYSRSQNGQKQLTFEELTILLHQMVASFKSSYILLDALDECTDREDLLEFIEALMKWNVHDLHVLATSRKENDIAMSLEPLVTCQLCIQSALVDADICVHVRERLSHDPKLKKWPVDVQKEIEAALTKGAKGMFRWVVCQLDSLRKCLKLDALRRALNTLPRTLDDTYERILSNLDEEYEEYALKIFQWLCFSERAMRLDEMVEVLAIDSSDNYCFRPEQRLPDPHDILTICSTLVSVTAIATEATSTQTTESEELKLAHFSVKEYLISERLEKASMHRYHITSSSANFSIAKSCLTYLLYFESPTILTAKFDQEFPLIRYAAKFWSEHYRCITDDADREAVDVFGCNLVESENFCFINWLRIFNPETPWEHTNIGLQTSEILSPLYYMSILGVKGVLKMLLNKGVNVNAECGLFGNALKAASWNGHEHVVQLLLENGANVTAEGGEFGNALLAVSYKGHEEVVRLLLANGANVNTEGGNFGNALSAASYSGHGRVVQLLLEKGANINAGGGKLGSPLSAASYKGHEGVVQLLLENGANINADGGRLGNALSAASSEGHDGVVRLLLENEANVNAEGGELPNALSAASYGGHKEVVQLLLENGANVNAEGGKFGKALSAASSEGHEGVVQLLLENGANVNAEGGAFGNALSAASYSGEKEVVRLLLEAGANANAECGKLGSPLSAASSRGWKGVVRLLLENGANVNAESGRLGNALSAASCGRRKELVQLLLENGANVNAEGGAFGNALSAASHSGQEEVVRLLLEAGANVNAEGGEFGNALSAASYKAHEEVVQLLLENGANVNAEGGKFGNALSAASYRGRQGVVKLLLENGAEVNAESEEFINALSAASSEGHEGVVRLLLENGANVNAESGELGNALSAASYGGRKELVQLLLENGANVNAEGGIFGNALSAASSEGYEGVVRLLLENGANVNAEGGAFGNALSAASSEGHEGVVKLLLQAGANHDSDSGS